MEKTPEQKKAEARERVDEIAAEFAERGDSVGWFEALYSEAAGNNEAIPWADLEPNRFFRTWAESVNLSGGGRAALVVGCGLGDDAVYLDDLGFKVTAFDISQTAIEWARRIHQDREITFEVGDLLEPSESWLRAFDFVLEVYTIQPLPLHLRSRVINSIASFVAIGGELVVVTRGREDDAEPDALPWPVSRRELAGFNSAGFIEQEFHQVPGEEGEPDRFILRYERPESN